MRCAHSASCGYVNTDPNHPSWCIVIVVDRDMHVHTIAYGPCMPMYHFGFMAGHALVVISVAGPADTRKSSMLQGGHAPTDTKDFFPKVSVEQSSPSPRWSTFSESVVLY